MQKIKSKESNVKMEQKPNNPTKDEVYTEYRKYLIFRKDGKIHWETWNGNGNGCAYNHKELRFWAVF